ncbi:MAG: Ppx/GppA family phosphatase [Rhodovibrionaceae bacterium]
MAVVDIGSNSVRLVVFDGLKRVPTPVFNEKVLCGLGRDLAKTGKLNKDGVKLAIESLIRFTGIARAMGAELCDYLATAAVRDAKNGPEFVAEVEKTCACQVRILTGEEEARLSALGVLSSMPWARGAMGDLGGGSLEIVSLHDGGAGEGATLPLGPLRLLSQSGGDRNKAEKIIDETLAEHAWIGDLSGEVFYPVGGSWRALARIHMEQAAYPLHMVHGYSIRRKELQDLTAVVSQLGKRSLARIGGVPKRRLDTLPFAALLIDKLLAIMQPERVTFSAYGLREGWIFDQLPAQLREEDPLISAAVEWVGRDGRFGGLGDLLAQWTKGLYASESDPARRLRVATCHLSDIAWRDHPDYRAEQAFWRVMRSTQLCLEHHERAFIALALNCRYGGRVEDPQAASALQVLKPKKIRRAEVLGLAIRAAYSLCAGAQEVLERSSIAFEAEELELRLPKDSAVPPGPVLEKRLNALGVALGAKKTRIKSD